MNNNNNIDLITILGPTATGKTNLAVRIAGEISSEIISADSRQVYRGMDIGTGKDLSEYTINNKKIPYHLIDILNPSQNYSVYSFQKQFHKIYKEIRKKNKYTILCGGTALYIESVLLNYKISDIKPDYILRNDLEKLSKEELIKIFKELNKDTSIKWKCDTKLRIIRGIEISLKGEKRSEPSNYNLNLNKTLVLGIKMERSEIRKKITERLESRFKNGMIEEVEKLLSDGFVDFSRLNYFGLEYKYIGQYLSEKITFEELFKKLNTAIHKFAKKQMTFFRRMEKRGIDIHWIESGNLETVRNLINLK